MVSLDLPVNTTAEQSVLKALASAGVSLLTSAALRGRLEQAQSQKPTAEVGGKLAKMSAQISKGVEKFFYESEKKSIQYLQPVFDFGLNNISALARRADYADQIFQSGLLLIRAYEIRKKKDEANSIVDLMIRNFPTQPFTTSVIPPKVVNRLENARKELQELKTTLELVNKVNNKKCVAYLNGIAAPLNTPIFVAPNIDYHMRLDCGIENQVVWKTRIEEGQQVSIPITAGNPLIIGLSANDLNARQSAENALHAIMFWADLDHVIGVSENFKKDDRNVLLVRIQKSDYPRWSDGANTEDIYKALVRLFPDLPEQVRDSASSSENTTSYLGPILIGTGIVASGVGIGLLVSAINADDELHCIIGIEQPSCENPTKRITKENYEAQAADIQNLELISWITIGAGIATMITGGVIWYLDASETSALEDNISLSIDPISGEYSMGLKMTF